MSAAHCDGHSDMHVFNNNTLFQTTSTSTKHKRTLQIHVTSIILGLSRVTSFRALESFSTTKASDHERERKQKSLKLYI